jgi:hypothetical protein
LWLYGTAEAVPFQNIGKREGWGAEASANYFSRGWSGRRDNDFVSKFIFAGVPCWIFVLVA